MKHYCIYTVDIHPGIMRELGQLSHTDFEMHLNRTRFWLNEQDSTHMQFYIRWSHLLYDITHETDHGLGV
jgi:hypothetical protein